MSSPRIFETRNIRLKKMIEEWHSSRRQIIQLKQKQDVYKKLIGEIMAAKHLNGISTDEFLLIKRSITRMGLSKNDVPIEIWNQYANPTEFSIYYIKKK